MARRYTMWALLWIIPLLAVVVLYVLFRESNAFEFSDAPAGVKALGPIAAYLVLLMLSLRYRPALEGGLTPAETKLLGHWQLDAHSRDEHASTGDCDIYEKDGHLGLGGTFGLGGRLPSHWEALMAQLDGNQLRVVYDLPDLERDTHFQVFLTLVHNDDDPDHMVGDWNVIGQQGHQGTVEMRRTSQRERRGLASLVRAGARTHS